MIAMSGGVDSSVAGLLIKESGAEVSGVMMNLFDYSKAGKSMTDPEDAARIAAALGFPFEFVDFSEPFRRKVLDRFVSDYEAARTPNPCVVCNRFLKFGALLDLALERGCDGIATGHYVRKEQDPATGRYLLKKAADVSKDQTYMLYGLSQEQLSRAQFPLGGLHKDEVRRIAEAHGLVSAHKHDSQDICFVPDGSYADFIRDYTGRDYPPGDFVDMEGRLLGRHKGLIHYTIGQRKGLGLALPEPMYVVELDTANNRVVLGHNEDLFKREVLVHEINLIPCERLEEPIRVEAKTRYSHHAQPAVAEQLDEDTIRLVFDDPVRAITPGQSAVFYQGDTVVGGGVI